MASKFDQCANCPHTREEHDFVSREKQEAGWGTKAFCRMCGCHDWKVKR